MSEPRAESRAEAFLRGYKTFVRRNRALLTAVEQGAAGLVWFVPDGANAEIYAEAASSLVGVVGTLNEHLVPEDSSDDEFEDAKETPEEEDGEEEASEGDVGTAAAGPEPRRPAEFPDDDSAKNADAGAGAPPSAKTDPGASSSASGGSSRASTSARVSAFLEAVPVPMCLALISQVEVLTEMLAKRRARRRGDPSDEGLGPTVALEAVRAFAKTVLWSHQRGKLLVDDGLSREQLGEEVEGDEVERSSDPSAAPGLAAPPGPGFDRERRAALALHALYQFRLKAYHEREARELAKLTARREEAASGENPAGPSGPGPGPGPGPAAGEERSGENDATPASPRPAASPGAASAVGSPNATASSLPSVPPELRLPPPPPPGLTLADVLMKDRARLTLKLVGEALHIARPLLYANSMRKHGRKSWRPVLLSAVVDAAMFTCLNAAAGPGEAHFSAGERAEMRRRRALLAYYLLRSPVFDGATRPALGALGWFLRPVPLVGGVYAKAVDIAEDVNEHFAYTY